MRDPANNFGKQQTVYTSCMTAPELIGTDPALAAVRHAVAQVASTDATVLILGETGTGKEELVAYSVCSQQVIVSGMPNAEIRANSSWLNSMLH